MKKLILALSLVLTNLAFADGRGIVCDRADVSQGCEQYLIHLKKSDFDEYPRLQVSEFNKKQTCSLTGLLDTKKTDSLASVVGYLSRKADKLPRKIKLEGEYSSSSGFGLSSKTLVRVQIDLGTGAGNLAYRSGKGTFNFLTDNYLFASENDPARNEILGNCKEVDL